METQWKDDMNQLQRVRGATAKDKAQISALVPKSDAATAEKTTKHSQGTAKYSKAKLKLSKIKKNANRDYMAYKNFSTKLKPPNITSQTH